MFTLKGAILKGLLLLEIRNVFRMDNLAKTQKLLMTAIKYGSKTWLIN